MSCLGAQLPSSQRCISADTSLLLRVSHNSSGSSVWQAERGREGEILLTMMDDHWAAICGFVTRIEVGRLGEIWFFYDGRYKEENRKSTWTRIRWWWRRRGAVLLQPVPNIRWFILIIWISFHSCELLSSENASTPFLLLLLLLH